MLQQSTTHIEHLDPAYRFVAGASESQLRRRTFWVALREAYGLTPAEFRALKHRVFTCRHWISSDGDGAAVLRELPTGRWEVQFYTDGNPDGTLETSEFMDAFCYARSVLQ